MGWGLQTPRSWPGRYGRADVWAESGMPAPQLTSVAPATKTPLAVSWMLRSEAFCTSSMSRTFSL
jgi:hypothetical protein